MAPRPELPGRGLQQQDDNQSVFVVGALLSAGFDVLGVEEQPITVARVNAAARVRTRSFFTVTVLSRYQQEGKQTEPFQESHTWVSLRRESRNFFANVSVLAAVRARRGRFQVESFAGVATLGNASRQQGLALQTRLVDSDYVTERVWQWQRFRPIPHQKSSPLLQRII
jgi:hypothetical protein